VITEQVATHLSAAYTHLALAESLLARDPQRKRTKKRVAKILTEVEFVHRLITEVIAAQRLT
jgi:hypothetical protein